MSRIVGLNDLKKKEDEEKDPRQEQLFAGGLDQRGYVIFVSLLFNYITSVQYLIQIQMMMYLICRGGSGVNVLGPPGPNDNHDDGSLFGRIRAGAAAADALVTSSSAVARTVTIYRNGFTVDNGPLRDPAAPENASFLGDLARGRVPRGKLKLYSMTSF